MAKNYENTIVYSPEWKKMTGPISFSMSNDYLFRALMQKDERTLKAVVASFLRVTPESISEIEVTNPILLGADIDSKEYHLDIRTLLKHEKEIDLEMQVVRHPGWIERTHVNLTRIDLATEEDHLYCVTDWGRLFKATSWEELKMLAQENPSMDYTISSIYQLAEDEKIRHQMYRREENEILHRQMIENEEKAMAKAEAYRAESEAKDEIIKQKDATIDQMEAKIQELYSRIEALEGKKATRQEVTE